MTRGTKTIFSNSWVITTLAVSVFMLALFTYKINQTQEVGQSFAKGPRTKDSISVVEPGPYKVGQEIHYTFTASFYDPVNGLGPWIELICYDSRGLIFADSHSGNPGKYRYGEPFQLGYATAWQTGAADCTMNLYHRNNAMKQVIDASTSFHVDGL